MPENTTYSIQLGKHLEFSKGQNIFTAGDLGSEMYVILSGSVRIFIYSGESTLTLVHLKKGDFFGEMALLENLPRSASAEALHDVELVALKQNDFKFLIQQHPDIAMRVLGKFSSRLRDADNLIELLLLEDNTGNVLHCLVKIALTQYKSRKKIPDKCLLSISLESLAEMSNIDLQTTENVIKELNRKGLVTTASNGIELQKHKKLNYYLKYLEWKSKE